MCVRPVRTYVVRRHHVTTTHAATRDRLLVPYVAVYPSSEHSLSLPGWSQLINVDRPTVFGLCQTNAASDLHVASGNFVPATYQTNY